MLLQRIASPLFLSAALWASAAHAQTAAAPVVADNAWARASVTGQKATGAFMRLTASSATRLVRAESAAAGVTEIHEMKMDGDVMKMRAIAGLDLPAGQAVELKPGGYHVMLMDLKQQMKGGDVVPITLVFEDEAKKRFTQEIKAPVTALGGGNAAMKPGMDHGGMKH